MNADPLIDQAARIIHKLCLDIPSRHVGSEGNRLSTDYFAAMMESFGFDTECPQFECMDWYQEGAWLSVDSAMYEVFPSPYSRGCNLRAPLVHISSDSQLETEKLEGKIVLLMGEIAREQLMPKNFPFYNPDRHRRIIQLLEEKKPAAIITATGKDPIMVGSQYPFPLFEDGDFDIPSVYMKDQEGQRLAQHVGREVVLESKTERIPSSGCNVIARRAGLQARRIVLFAHIDARMGTPGAGDNASGVAVLLLLAELVAKLALKVGIEFVAVNGEDYYSNPGEQQFLERNQGRFDEILLGINLDDVGYLKGKVAYSFYECPEDLVVSIREILSKHKVLIEGQAWYQGDHMLFVLNRVPALAFTSEMITELMSTITHTPNDTPQMVDCRKLVAVAYALRDLIIQMDERFSNMD